MEIETTLFRVDEPNIRGITYPKSVAEKIVQQFQDDPSGWLGEATFPEGVGSIDLHRVSHEVIDLTLEDGEVKAKIRIMDTPMGKVLKQLVEADGKVSFALSGTGTPEQHDVRPDDFELIQIHGTIDGI